MSDILVVKLGGTTIADQAQVLAEVATVARRRPVVLVHGGGRRITEWLERLGVPSKFEGGLRVTDAQALEVAAAVGLTGTRADDLALRLKYAPRRDGGEWPIVTAQADLDAALMALIERTPVDGTVCVLATYTAMLGVRRNLQDRGTVGAAPR
jgi:hypothetical protein